MKFLKLALVAALSLGGWHWTAADEPTIYSDSYGWFSTSGYYAVEYWVDAYDNDGDLSALHVDAYDEAYNVWYGANGTGNGSHMQAHGYGCTIDGDTPGVVYATDSEGTHRYDVMFYY